MGRETMVWPILGVVLAVLTVAPNVEANSRLYRATAEDSFDAVPEVNFEFSSQNDTRGDDPTFTGHVGAALRAAAAGPWLALLLPLVVGLGLLEATLFHAALLHLLASLKGRPEAACGRVRWRWRATVAAALGAAWGVQLALLAGCLLTALRMRTALADGSFAHARTFAAFFPGQQAWYPLKPILYATPVMSVCYWIMLRIMDKMDERRNRRKQDQEEKLVKGSIDVSSLSVTAI